MKFHTLLLYLLRRQCNMLKMRWNSGWISACGHKKQRTECSNIWPREAPLNSAGPFVSLRSYTQKHFQLSLNNGETVKRSLLRYSPATGRVYYFQDKLQTALVHWRKPWNWQALDSTTETTGHAHHEPSKQVMSITATSCNLWNAGNLPGESARNSCVKLRSNTPICRPVLIWTLNGIQRWVGSPHNDNCLSLLKLLCVCVCVCGQLSIF